MELVENIGNIWIKLVNRMTDAYLTGCNYNKMDIIRLKILRSEISDNEFCLLDHVFLVPAAPVSALFYSALLVHFVSVSPSRITTGFNGPPYVHDASLLSTRDDAALTTFQKPYFYFRSRRINSFDTCFSLARKLMCTSM